MLPFWTRLDFIYTVQVVNRNLKFQGINVKYPLRCPIIIDWEGDNKDIPIACGARLFLYNDGTFFCPDCEETLIIVPKEDV